MRAPKRLRSTRKYASAHCRRPRTLGPPGSSKELPSANRRPGNPMIGASCFGQYKQQTNRGPHSCTARRFRPSLRGMASIECGKRPDAASPGRAAAGPGNRESNSRPPSNIDIRAVESGVERPLSRTGPGQLFWGRPLFRAEVLLPRFELLKNPSPKKHPQTTTCPANELSRPFWLPVNAPGFVTAAGSAARLGVSSHAGRVSVWAALLWRLKAGARATVSGVENLDRSDEVWRFPTPTVSCNALEGELFRPARKSNVWPAGPAARENQIPPRASPRTAVAECFVTTATLATTHERGPTTRLIPEACEMQLAHQCGDDRVFCAAARVHRLCRVSSAGGAAPIPTLQTTAPRPVSKTRPSHDILLGGCAQKLLAANRLYAGLL